MTSNKNLGNAGEFYVLAQLAQRGDIAGKTDNEAIEVFQWLHYEKQDWIYIKGT